jgi:hypothetical protein
VVRVGDRALRADYGWVGMMRTHPYRLSNGSEGATLTPEQWAAQPITPVAGCSTHRGFPTSYCGACRAMFDAANPNYQRPYPDEIV